MKNFTKIIGFVIALTTASVAQAIPTLYFDGSIGYTASSGELNVSTALIQTTDITPSPEILGSTMVFNAYLDSVQSLTAAGCFFFCATATKGNFSGDASGDDLTIYDGNGSLLLTAEFASLSLEGADGGNTGEMVGLLNATGGSLQNMFDNGDLFALSLNLNTVFSNSMYDQDFNGDVDGNIKGHSVPEPSLLALLSFGILFIGFARKSNSI